jgi:hypothetical protein
MSSLWDAVFIQVLDRTGPLMLNLNGTPYIIISGSHISATGGLFATGIGSGYSVFADFRSIVSNIMIVGSNISATGGSSAPGIGPGSKGSLETLSLSGSISVTVGSGWNVGCGIQANSMVTLEDATLTARTNAARLFNITLSITGSLDLSIVYTSEFTVQEAIGVLR